ncbi:MAG TPA: hypothetical protein VHP81_13185, partial [Lachnospiraceae bacterium]|nr:hypothetical protein [Lachnospiraceae bacterium]
MDQSINNEKKVRIYQEETERVKRVNNYMRNGLGLMYLTYILAIIITLTGMKTINVTFIANAISLGLCVICLVINQILFKRCPTSGTYRYITVTGFFLVYSIMLYTASDSYVIISLFAVLMGCIMYYDSKLTRIFAILMFLLILIRTIILIVTG